METKTQLLKEEELIKGDVIIRKNQKVVEFFRANGWINKTNTSLKQCSPFGLEEINDGYGVKQKQLYNIHYDENYKDDGYIKSELLNALDENKIPYIVETQADRKFEFEHKGICVKLSREFGRSGFTASIVKEMTTSEYDVSVYGDYNDSIMAINEIKKIIDMQIKNFEEHGSYAPLKIVESETYTLTSGMFTCEVCINKNYERIGSLNDCNFYTIMKVNEKVIDVRRLSAYKPFNELEGECVGRIKAEVEESFNDNIKRAEDNFKYYGKYEI